ncbi:MAG: exosortase family protein XrtG [Lachnospiraceae bacterium]|nr:exosortase family protein XrtG [Lachnospiraceae bacterium]
MKLILGLVGGLIWLYVLHVLTKAKINFWRFLWGSAGLFILLMVFVRPYVTQPLAQAVAAIAGFFGNATGTFTPYFRFATIFIPTAGGAMTMQIDFECSGILEIQAFLCLLAFFEIYTRQEKIMIGLLGSFYIILANAIRIVIICEIIHLGGNEYYNVAHTYVGRIFFYVLSVMLYFYVFTKPQVVKMRVGSFSYDND